MFGSRREHPSIDITLVLGCPKLRLQEAKQPLTQVETLQPHIVMMDLPMPILDGIAATIPIRQYFSETKVMVLPPLIPRNPLVIYGVMSLCSPLKYHSYDYNQTNREES